MDLEAGTGWFWAIQVGREHEFARLAELIGKPGSGPRSIGTARRGARNTDAIRQARARLGGADDQHRSLPGTRSEQVWRWTVPQQYNR
jgi:hypothetical protein